MTQTRHRRLRRRRFRRRYPYTKARALTDVLTFAAVAAAGVSAAKAGWVGRGGAISEVAADGGAQSAANAARLRLEMASEQIVEGHAYQKHFLTGEFADLGIDTKAQWQDHIRFVMTNPTGIRYYRDGRVVYLHEPTATVVIDNPSAEGTAFRPGAWWDYLDTLPKRTTPFR